MGIHLSLLQLRLQAFLVVWVEANHNLEPRVILAPCQRHGITFVVHALFVIAYRKIPNDGVVAFFSLCFFVK